MSVSQFWAIDTAYAQGINGILAEDQCAIDYPSFVEYKDNQCFCQQPGGQSGTVLCENLPLALPSQLCTTPKGSVWSTKDNACICLHGLTKDNKECLANNYGNVGLNCSAQDIINNTCTRNINKTLGIKASNPIPNPELFVQDIILAATSFLGTGLFVAVMILGIKSVIRGGSGSEDQMGNIKSGLRNLAIGAGIILFSYTVIRVVQYVARGY